MFDTYFDYKSFFPTESNPYMSSINLKDLPLTGFSSRMALLFSFVGYKCILNFF